MFCICGERIGIDDPDRLVPIYYQTLPDGEAGMVSRKMAWVFCSTDCLPAVWKPKKGISIAVRFDPERIHEVFRGLLWRSILDQMPEDSLAAS